jgi:NAD(P)-dependent dehydrogenase (short-subunit alcohol dehydrogenase family)
LSYSEWLETRSTAYCATKGAVHAVTRVLACGHAPEEIRVNAVCPSYIETPMLLGSFDEARSPVSGRDLAAWQQEVHDIHPSKASQVTMFATSCGVPYRRMGARLLPKVVCPRRRTVQANPASSWMSTSHMCPLRVPICPTDPSRRSSRCTSLWCCEGLDEHWAPLRFRRPPDVRGLLR